MIDDDDAKIRRNLLVFSVLVLLAEWFDLQLGQLVRKTLQLETELDPLKLCMAALATLVYLALRYKDARLDENRKYREIVDADLAAITPTVALHYAQLMANLYTWTGFESSIFLGHLKTHINRRASGMGFAADAPRPKIWLSGDRQDEVGQMFSMSENPKVTGQWEVGVSLGWNHGTAQGASSGGVPLAVEATSVHRCLIWAYSRAWWFFYCEAAVRARMPILFGIAAVTILCEKVWALVASR